MSSFSRARSSVPGYIEAVEGRVLIYIHKEQQLDDVEKRYPGPALRPGGRQAAHPDRSEEGLGGARDDCLPAPGALRQ